MIVCDSVSVGGLFVVMYMFCLFKLMGYWFKSNYNYIETCLKRTSSPLAPYLHLELTAIWFIQAKLTMIPILGLYLKFSFNMILFYSRFSLDMILFYSGFSLDRTLFYSGFSLDMILFYSGFSLDMTVLFRVQFRHDCFIQGSV
jgi:hypothetical protein